MRLRIVQDGCVLARVRSLAPARARGRSTRLSRLRVQSVVRTSGEQGIVRFAVAVELSVAFMDRVGHRSNELTPEGGDTDDRLLEGASMIGDRLRRPVGRILLAAIVALGVEVLACGGLWILEARGVRYQAILADHLSAENRRAIEEFLGGRNSPFQLDSVLGWALRPGFSSETVTVDAAGRRRSLDRPRTQVNAVRVMAFGDSFTFGGDVADPDSYPEALARLDHGIDVANFGVPAYGLDQAFLRYSMERTRARSQIVVIGYLSENICRNVSVFRPFYNPNTVFPLAKPRYVAGGQALRLIPNPLPTAEAYERLLANPTDTLAELGRHDAHYRALPHAGAEDRSATVRLVKLAAAQLAPTNRGGCYGDAEAFSVTTALFERFYETACLDGAEPVILIFPTRADVLGWRSGRPKSYAPLLRFFAERSYRFVDAMDAFDRAGRHVATDELIPSHLTPLGNTLAAEHLHQRLESFGLLR
jgi:hypothetical protein